MTSHSERDHTRAMADLRVMRPPSQLRREGQLPGAGVTDMEPELVSQSQEGGADRARKGPEK